tara:strand:+ start:803 stop:1141 length:339 start_codon:yes stop_codon:yes gene_type:complete
LWRELLSRSVKKFAICDFFQKELVVLETGHAADRNTCVFPQTRLTDAFHPATALGKLKAVIIPRQHVRYRTSDDKRKWRCHCTDSAQRVPGLDERVLWPLARKELSWKLPAR